MLASALKCKFGGQGLHHILTSFMPLKTSQVDCFLSLYLVTGRVTSMKEERSTLERELQLFLFAKRVRERERASGGKIAAMH